MGTRMSKRAATNLQDGDTGIETPALKRKKITIDLAETQITDINNSCLENIFNHLSLTDLLNVAESSKLLKIVAESTFTRKYGGKMVDISKLDYCDAKHHGQEHLIEVNDNENSIKIICMKLGLKLLRCFGHLMRKLKHKQNHEEIESYISKYCAKSLIEIKFAKNLPTSMNNLKKPFSKVEKVEFRKHILGSNLSELNKWFPNMRHLRFCNSMVSIENGIVAHHPHLEHLTIDINRGSTEFYIYDMKYINVRKNMVSSILRLNPTLRSLHIINKDGCINAKYYQSVSQHLQKLESLELDVHTKFLNLDDATVHLKSVKKLKINYKSFDPIAEFKFSFDGLEEFTFESSVHEVRIFSYALSNMLIDFIGKQQTLTKMILSCHTGNVLATFPLSERIKSKLALPSLKEVILKSCAFSEDEMMAFLEKCKLLRKFCFKYYSKNHRCAEKCCNSRGEVSCKHFKDFQKRLGNDWRASMDGKGNMELIRAFVQIN